MAQFNYTFIADANQTVFNVASQTLVTTAKVNGVTRNFTQVADVVTLASATSKGDSVVFAVGEVYSPSPDETSVTLYGPAGVSALTNNIIPADLNSWTDAAWFQGAIIQLTGTASGGAITFEGSNDGVNAFPLVAWDLKSVTPALVTAFNVSAGTLAYGVNIPCKWFRVRISTALTGGTIQCIANFDEDYLEPPVLALAAGASSSNIIGAVGLAVSNGTTNGLTTVARLNSSAASTNATNAKAIPGRVYKAVAFNASAAVKYLKLYNKASAPVPGTDTPVLNLPIPVGYWEFNIADHGIALSLGISYAITGAAADLDATAVAAGDIVGLNIIYS